MFEWLIFIILFFIFAYIVDRDSDKCRYCGSKFRPDDEFCSRCGSKL